MESNPTTILQIYKQCVRPIFEYGIVSTITVSDTVITKIQRIQNSFIRLALRLPECVSARLLHEASGLPYIRERLITVGQNHLARMHANPLVEHTANSARTNIAWDRYKTPISILNPIQAGVFWNHIGWGGGQIVPPSVSPLFVVQLQLNLAR